MGIGSKLGFLFEPPAVVYDEEAHRKWLLHFVLCFFLAIVTLVALILFFTMREYRARWAMVAFVIDIPCVVFLALNRANHSLLASRLLVLQFWLVPTVFAITAGGIHAPAVIAYLIVTFLAGQLLGATYGFVAGLICGLTLICFACAEQAGALPGPTIKYTPYSFALVQGMYLAFFTCLQWVIGKGTGGALARARNQLVKRQRAEAILQESEERYRLVIEQTGQLVYDYDVATGKITWFGAILQLTGFTAEEFQKVDIARWETMIHPEDRGPAMEALDRAMREVGPYQVQYRFACRSGSYIYVDDHGLFLPDEKGNAKRMLGTMSDVTARKLAELKNLELTQSLEIRVQERTAELQAANRELEAFSYSASHDLQAPLRYINGFTEILIEDYAAGISPDMRELLDRIRGGAIRMQTLINDLLEFSRSSRQPIIRSSLDIAKIVRELVDELALKPPTEIDLEELPRCSGDETLIKQVFANLIGNAVKFSRLNERPRIEINSILKQGETIYYVRDNGVGFDPKHAAHLFTAFQRFHRKEQFEGTGIGLSVVHRIIERHGGRIWAESEPGKGATFYFTIGDGQKERR